MRGFEDNSYDMVFTSPPFKDEDVEGDYWDFYDSFFKEAYRVTNKALIIIHSATKLEYLYQHYPPKRIMIWGKGVVKYSWRFNPILVYQKNEYKVNKYIWSDVFGVAPIYGSEKAHKYQDPEILYQTILSMFKDCKTVLDPFMGSGTTGRACLSLQKDFTGIDIIRENVQLSQQLLQTRQEQKTLT